jgi:hypothetical protein
VREKCCCYQERHHGGRAELPLLACKELDSAQSNGGPEREPGREATGSTNATEQADTTREVSSWVNVGGGPASSLPPSPPKSNQKIPLKNKWGAEQRRMNRTSGPNLVRRVVVVPLALVNYSVNLKEMPIGSRAEDARQLQESSGLARAAIQGNGSRREARASARTEFSEQNHERN